MSDSGDAAAPGWYHAEGDPPGTERYWDGSAWTEGPRPVGGVPPSMPQSPPSAPASPGQPPMMPDMGQPPVSPGLGQPPVAPVGAASSMYYQDSKANVALGTAIGGLLCCTPVAFYGLWKGIEERREIAAGRRDPANDGKALAAIVIGGLAAAATVILVLLLVVGAAVGG